METFFWSFVSAAISALTFVAYKHPDGFSRNIFPPLMLFLVFSTVGVLVSYLAIMSALTKSLPGEIARAKESVDTLAYLSEEIVSSFTWFKYSLGAFVIVLVYILILKYLPTILRIEMKNKKTNTDEREA